MDDQNSFNMVPYQDALPLSQDTFSHLWDEFCQISAGQVSVTPEISTSYENLVDTTSFKVESTGLVPLLVEEPVASSSTSCVSPSCSVTSNGSYIPSSLPASQNWSGPNNFNFSFGQQEKSTKGVAWTYSNMKDKLYVKKDTPCAINFSTDFPMDDDVSIRIMALFSSPEHASEIVQRCITHAMEDLAKGVPEAQHLVRCESRAALYEVDPNTQHHSVVVPFENPSAGQFHSTYIFKFSCFGSCAGGLNRRPLMLIFTLEKGGRVIGRRKLDVKICACPGRDRKVEEQQGIKTEKTVQQTGKRKYVTLEDTLKFASNIYLPPPKKSKRSHQQKEKLTITVETEDCLQFLKRMKQFYEMCCTLRDLPPSVKKALVQRHGRSSSECDSSSG